MENTWLRYSYPIGSTVKDMPVCVIAGCNNPKMHGRARCQDHYMAQQKEYQRDRRRKAKVGTKK